MQPEWKDEVVEARRQNRKWKEIASLIWHKQKPSEWKSYGFERIGDFAKYLKEVWEAWI